MTTSTRPQPMGRASRAALLGTLALLVAVTGGGWLIGVVWGYEPSDPRTSQELSGTARQRAARTMERAAMILAALESHRDATGKYPARLEDLVPAHLSALLLPCTGNPGWAYWTDGNKFNLAFGMDGQLDKDPTSPYPCWYFESATGEWKNDT